MSTIIESTHRQRDLVNQKIDQGLEAVNKKVGTPLSDSILNLIVRKDSFTQRLSKHKPLSQAQGKFQKLKAVFNNYDNVVKKLDGAGIKSAARVYQGITVGLAPVTRSVVGQIAVKALATSAAGLTRLIAKVVEYALRILPYIALPAAAAAGIVAGIHGGAFVAAAAYVAGHATSFAFGTAGTVIAVSLLSNQVRTTKQGKEIKEIKEDVKDLNKTIHSPEESEKSRYDSLKQRVREHKGKIAASAALLLSAASAGGVYYYGVPEVVTEKVEKVVEFVKNNVPELPELPEFQLPEFLADIPGRFHELTEYVTDSVIGFFKSA